VMGNGSAEGDRGGGGLPPPAAREPSFFFFIFRLLLRHVSLYRFSLNRRYLRDWPGIYENRSERDNAEECQLIIHGEHLIIPNTNSLMHYIIDRE
jgi:hypothetical protein